MEIIFKEVKGNLFGSTNIIGIGKRQPKLMYGQKAKELRENAELTVDELAKKFDVRPNIINKVESQTMSLDDKMFNKYNNEFHVEKEYFFDLDLETLILSGDGHILKSFETSEECRKVYNDIMEDYFNAVANKDKFILVDFSERKED